MEKLAGLNLLYALVILLWPYDVFLVFLIKATGILQIINTVCFVYVLVRCRVRIDPLSCAGAAALCWRICCIGRGVRAGSRPTVPRLG